MEKTGCVGSTERWHNPCKARIPLFVGDLRSLPWWKKVPLGLPQAAVELGQCLSETALPDQEQMRAGGSPGLYGNNLPLPFLSFCTPLLLLSFPILPSEIFPHSMWWGSGGNALKAMHWRGHWRCNAFWGGPLTPDKLCRSLMARGPQGNE